MSESCFQVQASISCQVHLKLSWGYQRLSEAIDLRLDSERLARTWRFRPGIFGLGVVGTGEIFVAETLRFFHRTRSEIPRRF